MYNRILEREVHTFEYKEIIDRNPFNRMQIRFREPMILPKTIPLHTVERFLAAIYQQYKSAGTVLIYGKGDKERRIQIGNESVIQILEKYKNSFSREIQACGHFFVNQAGNALSDQAVRRMINKYTALASIELHITPHMFRHTFATSLLEADVDIRFIQEMLGHSSINITEIYTHVVLP